MVNSLRLFFLGIVLILLNNSAFSQHSVAREWNELMLQAIRNDFARPTIHARNLFHASIAMYDCWAAYDEVADTYMLGKDVNGFRIYLDSLPQPDAENVKEAQIEAMSFAMYRIIFHRYRNSPGRFETLFAADDYMNELGYDLGNVDTTYQSGDPAHLGNYIAAKIIEYGYQDGANEERFYQNLYYRPVNPPLVMQRSGNPDITDLNRWQPLSLRIFIDQSGNQIPGDTPPFLSPEWGAVAPFALTESDVTVYNRDDFDYKVYHDPGPPVYISNQKDDPSSDAYKWGNSLVTIWGSHLDPSDGKMIDISPGNQGNSNTFPQSYEDYDQFYDFLEGGDSSQGHDRNPTTGQPYEENIVPRGDFARVLAEFWADGPDSETPPGHWFTIHNTVTDHPLFERKYEGQGEPLDPLEWDVKAYFTLGGALHDCAVTAWGIKGWYDYIRPVSAIRGMAELGQSSDSTLMSYHPMGISLVKDYIELVMEGDELAGANNENVGKVKVYSWKGPDYIQDTENDVAGVDWILAENWWPYQRPSFVTPPFAGYVSGHSTFSRAAAEVMTMLTGDPFFPGGMGEFIAKKNDFLVFEDGPSEDITLQWATYRDASDQTSLSRIWGGIHPPIDDIPGRIIGEKIGVAAYNKASRYFSGATTSTDEVTVDQTQLLTLSPNPISSGLSLNLTFTEDRRDITIELMDIMGKVVFNTKINESNRKSGQITIPNGLQSGIYILSAKTGNKIATRKIEIY